MANDTLPMAPHWLAPLLERFDRLLSALERGAHPVPTDEWLGAAELADALGVCERSIRTWEATGKLPPAVRIGRLKKWNRREVLAHLSKKH